MRKQLNVPKFKNEEVERKFWAKLNLSEYFEAISFTKSTIILS